MVVNAAEEPANEKGDDEVAVESVDAVGNSVRGAARNGDGEVVVDDAALEVVLALGALPF